MFSNDSNLRRFWMRCLKSYKITNRENKHVYLDFSLHMIDYWDIVPVTTGPSLLTISTFFCTYCISGVFCVCVFFIFLGKEKWPFHTLLMVSLCLYDVFIFMMLPEFNESRSFLWNFKSFGLNVEGSGADRSSGNILERKD